MTEAVLDASLTEEMARAMTDAELEARLTKATSLTVEGLREMAVIMTEKKRRGHDLSNVRIGLRHHLLRIGSGQLLPEVVVHFAGKPSLFNVIGTLPHDEQKRLADGQPVSLMVLGPDGRYEERLSDPLEMQPDQIALAFAPGRLREKTEQSNLLDQRRERASAPVPEQIGKDRIDPERGVAIIGRQTRTLAELESLVNALRKANRR